MSKISYKLYVLFTKIKFYFKDSKIVKFLDNKITYFFMGILLLILVSAYFYSINHHNGFQRWFNHNVFKINNIENKILILGIINIIYFIIIGLTHFYRNIEKIISKIKFTNKIYYIFAIYSVLISFSSFLELKTRILSIVTPFVFFVIYQIYNYIQETSQRYRFKFIFDSRYFFLIALVLLIYTPIFIYFDDKKIAENLSIYAYYALVIGVVYEIIINFFENKKLAK